MRQLMRYIPDDRLEAVTLDSNSVWDILKRAMIPSVKSGIIALSILTFAENWNMIEQPLILLSNNAKYPLSLAFNSIIQQSLPIAFAGSVLYMIPIIVLFLYFQEHIISGLENVKF